uniref:DUF7851 domain-containing protein n=1 Tax=Opuntia streptacantha TaxID=393608 RepID=A0A7C9CNW4_OPUST
MEEREKDTEKKKSSNKKQKHKHPNYDQSSKPTTPNVSFKPSSDVKGIKFGGQFIVKSFTVRRSRPFELSLLLNLPHHHSNTAAAAPPPPPPPTFPSTIAFLPTNFTILAHQAWHTLTLGLGTKKSKVIIFVFDTVVGKSTADLTWPPEIPLGEVNKRLIRGLSGWEVARFKFRKGCITFYVFAVRRRGERGFQCGEDLRTILHSVDALKDFLDHTAMLAMPNQRSINHSCNAHPHGHPVAAH